MYSEQLPLHLIIEYRQRLRVMLSATQASYDLHKSSGSITKHINYIYYFKYFRKYSTHPYWDEFKGEIDKKVGELQDSIFELDSSYITLNRTIITVYRNLSLIDIYINYIDKTVGSYIVTLNKHIQTQIQINKEKIKESIKVIDTRIIGILSCLKPYIREQLRRNVEQLQCINHKILLNILHIITELYKVECKVHGLKSEAKKNIQEIIGEDFKNFGIEHKINSSLASLSQTVFSEICCTLAKLDEYINHTVKHSGLFVKYLEFINNPQVLERLNIDSLINFVNNMESSIICLQHDYTQSLQSMVIEIYKNFDHIYREFDRFQNEFNAVEIIDKREITVKIGHFLYGSRIMNHISQRIYGLLPNRKTISLNYTSLGPLQKDIYKFSKEISDFRKELFNIMLLLQKLRAIVNSKQKFMEFIKKIETFYSSKTEDEIKKELEKLIKKLPSEYSLYTYSMTINVKILLVLTKILESRSKNDITRHCLINVECELEQINDEITKLKRYGKNIEILKYVSSGILELKEIQEKIRKEINRLQERFKRLKTFRSKLFSTLGNLASIGCYIEESVLLAQKLLKFNDMSNIIQKIHQLSDSIYQLNRKVCHDIFSENFKVLLKGRVEDLEYVNASILFVGDKLTKVTKSLGKYLKVLVKNKGVNTDIENIKTTEIKTIEVNIKAIKEAGTNINEQYQAYTTAFKDFKDKLKKLETSFDYLVDRFLRCSLRTTICRLRKLVKTTSGDCPDTDSNSCLRHSLLNDKVTTLEQQLYRYSRLVLGHSSIIDTRLLVSRLYKYCKKFDTILSILIKVNTCCCVCKYRPTDTNEGESAAFYFYDMKDMVKCRKYNEIAIKKHSKNSCLCLVVKYVLYPSLAKATCYLVAIELDISGSISRRMANYTRLNGYCPHGYKSYFSVVLMLAIHVFDKLATCIKKRYVCICDKDAKCCCKPRGNSKPKGEGNGAKPGTDKACNEDCTACKLRLKPCCGCTKPEDSHDCKAENCKCKCEHGKDSKKPSACHLENKCRCYICFCCYWDDTYYPWFISVIIWMAWLLDNLFTLSQSDVQHYAQLLSNLWSELQVMCCHPHKKSTPKPKPQKGIIGLLVDLVYEGAKFGMDTFSRLFWGEPLINKTPKPSSCIKNTCCSSDTPCNLCQNSQALYRVIYMARKTFYWVSPGGFTGFGVIVPPKNGKGGNGKSHVLVYLMAYYGPIINKITVTYYKVLEGLSRLSLNECQGAYFLQFISDLSFYILEFEPLGFGTKAYIANVINNYSAAYIYAIKKAVKPSAAEQKNDCILRNCSICKNHNFAIPLLTGLQTVLKPFMVETNGGSGRVNPQQQNKKLQETCTCTKCCLICLQSGDIMLFITQMLETIESYAIERKSKSSTVPNDILVSITRTLSITKVKAIQTNTKCQCTLVFEYFKYLWETLRTRRITTYVPQPVGESKAEPTAPTTPKEPAPTTPKEPAPTTPKEPAPTTPKEPAPTTPAPSSSPAPQAPAASPSTPPTRTVTKTVMTEIKGEPVIFLGLKNIMDQFFGHNSLKCGCESVVKCCCCCKCEECGNGKSSKCNEKGCGHGNGGGHGATGSPNGGGAQGGNGGTGQTSSNGADNKCPCQEGEGKDGKQCCCQNGGAEGKRKCCNCTKGEEGKPAGSTQSNCQCCCLSCCADKENEDKKPAQTSQVQQQQAETNGNNKCPCKKKKKKKEKNKPKKHCKNNKKYKDKRCCCKCCPEKKSEGAGKAEVANGTPPTSSTTTDANTPNNNTPKDEKECCCCCKCKSTCKGGNGNSESGKGCKCHRINQHVTSVQQNGHDKPCNCYCCFECKHYNSALKSVCKQLAYELKSSILVLSKLASNLTIECCEDDKEKLKQTLKDYLDKCNHEYPKTCLTATRTGRGCDISHVMVGGKTSLRGGNSGANPNIGDTNVIFTVRVVTVTTIN